MPSPKSVMSRAWLPTLTILALLVVQLAHRSASAQGSLQISSRLSDGTVIHRALDQPGVPPETASSTDPDLEPGFPVQAFHTAGTFKGGPAIHTVLANIDGTPDLEIIATGLATGPLYAWKSTGALVPGWPVAAGPGAGYPGLGALSAASPGLEVFGGFWGGSGNRGRLGAWTGAAALLPGWPRDSANFVSTPPALADVNGDGLDEIFIPEEDYKIHAYLANGTSLPGWPVLDAVGDQTRNTPAIADLDGDGVPEIIAVTGSANGIDYVLAYHRDGSRVAGFPLALAGGYPSVFPVVGDVDGDRHPEIIVVSHGSGPSGPTTVVTVLSNTGVVKRTMTATGTVAYGTAPALADLDGDGLPEIIVETDGAIDVWKGDGTELPGWPQVWGTGFEWLGNSAPVVGDVDGDGYPDIVVTSQVAGSSEDGQVRVYDRMGNLNPHFPKFLKIGAGAVPAIGDIDLDGRNEIVITGDFWNGFTGYYDKVWVYDLQGAAYGPVLWGQFMGGPKHQGAFQPLNSSCSLSLGLTDRTLNLAFEVGTTGPVTWNLWLAHGSTMSRLWSVPIPLIYPPLPYSFSIPNVSRVGTIGFLNSFTGPGGIECSDWQVIDTGTP